MSWTDPQNPGKLPVTHGKWHLDGAMQKVLRASKTSEATSPLMEELSSLVRHIPAQPQRMTARVQTGPRALLPLLAAPIHKAGTR